MCFLFCEIFIIDCLQEDAKMIQMHEAAALIARIEAPKLREEFKHIHSENPESVHTIGIDGQPAAIGFHTYSPGDKHREISIMIYVHPQFRRRGLGSRLYLQLLSEIDTANNDIATGAVYDGECSAAIPFIESLGGKLWYSMYDMEYDGEALPESDSIIAYSDEYYSRVVQICLSAWHELAQKYGFRLHGEDEAHRRALMRNAKNEYVYVIEGEIAAFCASKGDFLYGLVVDPRFQRRGIGRAMVEHGVNLVKLRGFERSKLCVISDNPARRIYEGIGFKPVAFRSYYLLPASSRC